MRLVALTMAFVLLVACGSKAEPGAGTLGFVWTGGRCLEIRNEASGDIVRWAEFDQAEKGEWNRPPPSFGACRLDIVSGTIQVPTEIPDGDYLICTAPRRDCQTFNLHSIGR